MWYGQVVLFFIAEDATSAQEQLDPPEWAEYAYVRYLEEVDEMVLAEHNYVDVRRNANLLWERIGKANQSGFKMFCWTLNDAAGFQCHPYTSGWGVVPIEMISHRVLMQKVQHQNCLATFG